MRDRYTLLFILAVLSALLIASCSGRQGYGGGFNPGELELYLRLQEELVDREEEELSLIVANTALAEERNALQADVADLARQIESATTQENFVQEMAWQPGMELPNPKDRITAEQILVTSRQVILDMEGVDWTYMLDSNSMDPLLDEGTHVLTVRPASNRDIQIGDIVLFRLGNESEHVTVVHRVQRIEGDEHGTYYITKGDNNLRDDPLKIRFDDIIAVVIAILY